MEASAHGKTNKDFIKTFVKHFHPMNQHKLPESIREDIRCLTRWFSGEDKLFMRRDNDDQGYLIFESVGKYRFHHSYKDTSTLFHKVLVDTIGEDTQMLRDIMEWQEFITWYPDKQETSKITYNYDDVALMKEGVYWLSKFTPKFIGTDKKDINERYKNRKGTDVIPDIKWEAIPDTEQNSLSVDVLSSPKKVLDARV